MGDYQWAEEILQETFLRAYTRAETFRKGARVSTWLYRIAMNLSYDHLRSPRNRPKVSLSERRGFDEDGASTDLASRLESGEDTPFETAEDEEAARVVRRAVADRIRSILLGSGSPDPWEVTDC